MTEAYATLTRVHAHISGLTELTDEQLESDFEILRSAIPFEQKDIIQVQSQGVAFGDNVWFSHQQIAGIEVDDKDMNKPLKPRGIIEKNYVDFISRQLNKGKI